MSRRSDKPARVELSPRPASRVQIYELESIYFTADYTNFGNVVKVRAQAPRCTVPSAQAPRCTVPSAPPGKPFLPRLSQGFGEFLTSKSAQAKNKNRQFRLEDRVFSLSSITSPGVRSAAVVHSLFLHSFTERNLCSSLSGGRCPCMHWVDCLRLYWKVVGVTMRLVFVLVASAAACLLVRLL